ncbi:sigma 54-interacting transcriptional regulator [Candidatus Desantisbacteria bacterium]|nr:sigma 54-interacting transcriptional regulator [Candidatus Desantisbacteria bacterium]
MYAKKMQIYIGIGIICSILTIIFTSLFSDVFNDWELKTYDYRMKLRSEIKVSPDIILVDIDDRSINAIGRWPWDRTIHAKIIDKLTGSGAKIIAYDIFFNASTDKKSDNLLAEASKKANRVYYPVGFDFSEVTGVNKNDEISYVEKLGQYSFGKFIGDTNDLLSVNRAILPIEEILKASKGVGHISSNKDIDGKIRRVPLIVKVDDMLFPSFGLASLLDYLDVSRDNIVIKLGESITLKSAVVNKIAGSMNRAPTLESRAALNANEKIVGVRFIEPVFGSNQVNDKNRKDIVIPIDNKGMMLINYAGQWNKTYKHYSFKNLLDNELQNDVFKDKFVIVSNAASGFDLKQVPLQNSYPGGGIHANIINTILTENFLIEPNSAVKIIIIVLLGIIGALSGVFTRWELKIAVNFIILFIYFTTVYYLFKLNGIVLNVLSPTMACIFGAVSVSFYETQFEKRNAVRLNTENQKLEEELLKITTQLNEKENEIIKIQKELSIQSTSVPQLNEKRDEKEELEIKKITILKKLTPSQFEELRKEAENLHIITKDRNLLEAFDMAKRVAPFDHTVLILGETGTGKELFANALHAMSKRKKQKFAVVECSSINLSLAESEFFGYKKGSFTGAVSDKAGLFKEANNGTIFLDEIGELPCDVHPKLLRVLQNRQIRPVGSNELIDINVRVIAAGDKDIASAVNNKMFNTALFARLNRYPIVLPALRERKGDIPDLAAEFIRRHKEKKNILGISKDGIEELMKYNWPNNIRQLENIIIRTIINANNDYIQLDDVKYAMEQDIYKNNSGQVTNVKIPEESSECIGNDYQKRLIEELRKTNFNIKETAEILNMGRNTVTDNFKGICFKNLAENNGDIKKTANLIAGHPDSSEKLEKKIAEYYENLISNVNQCENVDIAKQKVRLIYKNIPKEYFCYIDVLIEKYFKL